MRLFFLIQSNKKRVKSMREYDIYPATVSNQITEGCYFALVGQINAGTCNKQVSKVLRKNGCCEYFTYHLISTR